MRKGREKKLYAAYRGDKFRMIGTVEEIAEKEGVKVGSIYSLISRQRHYIDEPTYENKLIVVEAGGDDDE